MNSPTSLTPQQLHQAADIQQQILDLQNELSLLLGGAAPTGRSSSGRRRLSAEGLANIRAGARKRWAKFRSENGGMKPKRTGRRKMSAAGRAAIAARMRARWAAAKRSGRNAL